jgi:predicted MFS family arabinose efflux permease
VTASKTHPPEALNAAASERAATKSAATAAVPRAAIVMSVLLLIFFLGTSDNQMISPLLPRIAEDFGYGTNVGVVGRLLYPAYALAAAAAALLIGPLSDKYGRRRFLLYASIVFGVSLLAAALIHNLYLLAAVRMITGIAAGTFSTCSIAYVADYFPYERRGVAMSVVQAGYFFALVFGVPVANQIANWKSWRLSFALFGFVSLIAFALIAALLPEDKHTMAEMNLAARMARRFDNIRTIFESRPRVAAIISAFFVSGGFVGFFSYLGSWLKQGLGLSPTAINGFFALVGVALLIGAFVAGPVADRFGKRGLSILATVVLAPTLVVIPHLGWGVALFVVFLISALAFAFRQGPLQALATELVPRRARGALVAVRNTASQIGIATATLASGALYDKLGFISVGLVSGVLTFMAAVCILMMREPTSEPAAQEPNE